MNASMRPMAEITEQATAILIREMGVVDALRFLNQVRAGSGDYTKERRESVGDLSLDQITAAIKAKRPKKRRRA
jgi:hypothetical protein